MSQTVVVVTLYLSRRKRGRSAGYDGRYTYEVWVVAEVRPTGAADAVIPQLTVDPGLSAESAWKLGDDLRKAIAKVAAHHVEQMVWKIDDVSENKAADLIVDLPDSLQRLADRPFDGLAVAAGMPAAAASLTADVVGTVVMRAVVEPAEKAVHALEVAAIITALLTGMMHPLAITCVKHLAYDKLGGMLAKAFSQVISDATTAGPATASRRPEIFDADPVITDSFESEPPRGVVIDPVTGMARREGHGVAEVADAAPATVSPDIQPWLCAAVEEAVSGHRRPVPDPSPGPAAV